ncbi:4-hydroxybenzoate octaprenyltransferase [Chthonobacter albigriseus]|uniref:4-hydroxybenzoate octaprenyltransferase n=1 Tax=Chthonobacter albigriseus TaxID=1683161 RepID=UPI0015EE4226|nr:4-hydroxybenzoate octaprenyltransferase [Chthonobacter albigriseus]
MTDRPSPTIPDAPRGNWVDAYAPSWAKPYAQLARLDRPIGWWLLLWPCWWSLALATGAAGEPLPNLWHLLLFLVGSVVMRGAGCTYNDIVDRDIDAKVGRTLLRPIPSGRVTVEGALGFMVLQALIGFVVLIQFNLYAILLGIASLSVVAIYPFMKRITGFPQVILGLAFSWGALMGWAATFGGLALPPVLLYLAAVSWTVGYDTIYAHQDREDDALIGLGSTARTFGDKSLGFLAFCYALSVLMALGAIITAQAGIFAYIGAFGFGAHLAWQVARFNMNDGGLCLALFKSNREAGWLLFVGLLVDAAIGSI